MKKIKVRREDSIDHPYTIDENYRLKSPLRGLQNYEIVGVNSDESVGLLFIYNKIK